MRRAAHVAVPNNLAALYAIFDNKRHPFYELSIAAAAYPWLTSTNSSTATTTSASILGAV